MDYAAYISSEKWQIRRKRALVLAANKCQVCASTMQLKVHHNEYDRLGNEADSDLVVLCARCHHLLHKATSITGGHISFDKPSGPPPPPVKVRDVKEMRECFIEATQKWAKKKPKRPTARLAAQMVKVGSWPPEGTYSLREVVEWCRAAGLGGKEIYGYINYLWSSACKIRDSP